MRILPVALYNFNIVSGRVDNNRKPVISCAVPVDTVSFSGVAQGGNYLKKLAAYGIPDMYTGKIMLSQRDIEIIFAEKVFKKNINYIIEFFKPYRKSLQPVESKFYNVIKNLALKHPNISLNEAMKMMYPENNKKLLRSQQHVFESLTACACDMPEKQFKEFLQLMHITQKRLANDPVVLPFKEKEFLYKIRKIFEEVKIKNSRAEIKAMMKIEKTAKKFFGGCNSGDDYLDKSVLKSNSNKINLLRIMQKKSALKYNSDLSKLFEDMSARIHGFPYVESFGRKSFIHDLRKIVETLKDKALAEKIINIVSKLPTSANSLPAFIVKYADASSEQIGFHMIKKSVASIDHLIPKNRGGRSRLSNYGLCSVGVNADKTNIPFDKWVRLHPVIYKNCQKYVDRLIELCNAGFFDKINLPRSYITDFAKTVYEISPKENRIILDLSKLKD